MRGRDSVAAQETGMRFSEGIVKKMDPAWPNRG